MSGPLASGRAGLVNDVVGVEVTTDGMLTVCYMLVVTDRLHLVAFPTALGIRINDSSDRNYQPWSGNGCNVTLPPREFRDANGQPYPKLAAMADTSNRPDREWRLGSGVAMLATKIGRAHV